ncbi:hypothetical protein PIB30_046597 [Stylosanthes scabra]|uniref:Uncharacterized protein n=1 Tax=Stylosanthes scabra TaxID=79078 RepID=A0ABU6RGI8_9FABA|nr:hypothetical protein [Stylosanthes scabra]
MEAKKNKRSKENGQKAKKSPIQRRPRARALLSLIWKFSLVARPRDPDGAPAPPHFVTPKTRTSRARVMEVVRLRGGNITHLNEGYFGDFTFPGQGPSISQAQFDLYGGGTAEAQHTFSHFINFSLRPLVPKDKDGLTPGPRTVELEDEKPGTYGTGLIPPTRHLDRVWLRGLRDNHL